MLVSVLNEYMEPILEAVIPTHQKGLGSIRSKILNELPFLEDCDAFSEYLYSEKFSKDLSFVLSEGKDVELSFCGYTIRFLPLSTIPLENIRAPAEIDIKAGRALITISVRDAKALKAIYGGRVIRVVYQ